MNLSAAGALRTAFLAFTFLLVCILGTLAFVLLMQIRRARVRGRAEAENEKVRQLLVQSLVQFLAGSPDDSAIREYLKTHREEIAEALMRFQATVAGGARDRLCHLALDLGLVHDWCQQAGWSDVLRRREAMARLAFACSYEPCRRVSGEVLARGLEDSDAEVRLSAARGLVQTGNITDIEDVLLLAVGPNRFQRAVLAEELRRHAMVLCREAVPEVLASGKTEYVRAVLEILAAWERALPIGELSHLLEHSDREIRALALRLVPLAVPDESSRASIVRAIGDSDPEVSGLAVVAAGRLKIDEARDALQSRANAAPIELAKMAREALAALGAGA